MYLIKILVLILAGYFLGSIPFGFVLVKIFKKLDIRTSGTGNIGATNTMVIGGKGLGTLTLILDIAKGSLAVILAKSYLGSDLAIILCGLAVIIGHDFSIFLKFKGGKGIATTTGVMFLIDPVITVICILLYILVLVVARYLIISTLIILAALPIILWITSYGFDYILMGLAFFILALYAHRVDVMRFLSGDEIKLDKAIEKYA